ncbi:hypothetical protein BU15DRAFT_65493 [Melanogaster broomeanus]|nr:hypothetical protein BU15DRAFT_65493 [Melanogaster broomeanus]
MIESSQDFDDVKAALNERTEWTIAVTDELQLHSVGPPNGGYFVTFCSLLFLLMAEIIHLRYGRLSPLELKECVENMGYATFAILIATLDLAVVIIRVAGIVAASGSSWLAMCLILICVAPSSIVPLLIHFLKRFRPRTRQPTAEGEIEDDDAWLELDPRFVSRSTSTRHMALRKAVWSSIPRVTWCNAFSKYQCSYVHGGGIYIYGNPRNWPFNDWMRQIHHVIIEQYQLCEFTHVRLLFGPFLGTFPFAAIQKIRSISSPLQHAEPPRVEVVWKLIDDVRWSTVWLTKPWSYARRLFDILTLAHRYNTLSPHEWRWWKLIDDVRWSTVWLTVIRVLLKPEARHIPPGEKKNTLTTQVCTVQDPQNSTPASARYMEVEPTAQEDRSLCGGLDWSRSKSNSSMRCAANNFTGRLVPIRVGHASVRELYG